MSATRFDLYTLVHKGHRRVLFELTGAAGQIGPEDAGKRQALAASTATFIKILTEHARYEDKFVGPLLAEAAPAVGEQLTAEHVKFEHELQLVQSALTNAAEQPSIPLDLAVYRALARFTAAYFVHIDLEESTMPALWARFDDATLAKAQGQIVAAHSPDVVQANLRNMLPATSSFERVRFLRGLKASMPPPAFAMVRGVAGPLVDAGEWQAIDAA